jgi:hypothetical protein
LLRFYFLGEQKTAFLGSHAQEVSDDRNSICNLLLDAGQSTIILGASGDGW